jgi:hypothetical protein
VSKVFCFFGLAVALLMLLIFALDLAVGIPFSRASLLMDIGSCIAALGLAAISFMTLNEAK